MRRRSSWHERFFAERHLTSQLKHLVLRDYVREFAFHLGSVRPTLYYIDGFAGPGVYRSTGKDDEAGSPLLIAELARIIHASPNPFELKCLNVEKRSRSFQSLTAVTAPYQPDIVEHNYHAQFVDVIPDIIRRIGRAPAFFFIDPFGTKDIPFDALQPIFARRSRTEVLITFHADGIAKKAGFFDSLDSSDVRKARLARALTSNLAAALALPLEDLQSRWHCAVKEGHGGTEAFEDEILTHFRSLLRGSATAFNYTKAFPVRYQPAGGQGSPVCFYLVFATQHQHGLEEMNNVMARELERFEESEYSDSLFPGIPADIENQRIGRIAEELVRKFADRTFTLDLAKLELMQDSTILARGGEYRKAVFRLDKDGRIDRLQGGRILNSSPLRIRNN